jgi:hypothetical protein
VGERVLDFEPPSTLLFFSRSIGLTGNGEAVPITAGAKVTGKMGKYEVGMLEVLTSRTSYRDDNDTDEEHDDKLIDLPRQNFSVLRVKRDILAKSSIGVIATSKDLWEDVIERNAESRALLSSEREENRVFAADVNLAFGTGTRLTGFLGKSHTSVLRGRDWAGTAFFSHERDRWGFNLEYSDIQENFEAQLGFVQRNGVRKSRAIPFLSQRWSRGPIRQTWFFNSFQYITDQDNDLETRTAFNGFFNLFRNGSELFIATLATFDDLDESFELREGVEVPAGAHSFRSFLSEFSSDKSKRVSVEARVNAGEFYNGHLAALGGGVLVRPNANLSLELNYTRTQVDLPVKSGAYGTDLGLARIVYSFTPRLFAKVFTQYNSDDARFRFNLLVNWIHRPGSNLFLVYNEEQDTGGANWRSRNRTLLAKFNYLVGW